MVTYSPRVPIAEVGDVDDLVPGVVQVGDGAQRHGLACADGLRQRTREARGPYLYRSLGSRVQGPFPLLGR
jgi:hypothetical protein